MAISLNSIQRGPEKKPPRILLYTVHGFGKTTFASQAWKPIFIMTEEGIGKLSYDRFPLCKSYEDVISALDSLMDGKHDYKSCVIDTADGLERLVFDFTAKKGGKANIEDFGFGKGYNLAATHWGEILSRLEFLRDKKKMAVILLSHASIKTFNAPDIEPYDRYQPDLHKVSASYLCEWVDIILFGNYKVYTREVNKTSERVIAEGSGERLLFTEERPAHWGKNRYGLPFELQFSFSAFAKALTEANGKSGKQTELHDRGTQQDDGNIENDIVETVKEETGAEDAPFR